MAKGAEEKEIVINKILELFGSNAFKYDKEIRVNVNDEQIKITLTCAKTKVSNGEDTAMPGDFPEPKVKAETVEKEIQEPTPEEMENVANLMASLGL